MVSLVQDMSHVPSIKEETSTDLIDENIGKTPPVELSPRSKAKPRRDRSSTSSQSVSSSLRSSDGGGGLLKLQLMNGSVSLLDSINLEDLPQEGSRKNPRQQRKPRSDAVERLHDSMSALEGISPEELVEEANRRRNERVNRYQKSALSASLPPSGANLRTKMDPKFHASAPAPDKSLH